MLSAPTLAKFAGIMYLTLELGVLHIALTHIWHFPSGMYLKNLYSVRELAKRVVTACKGSRDFQPLALLLYYKVPPISPPLKYTFIFRPGPPVCPDSLTWKVP